MRDVNSAEVQHEVIYAIIKVHPHSDELWTHPSFLGRVTFMCNSLQYVNNSDKLMQ
jgi:hypothetical protein